MQISDKREEAEHILARGVSLAEALDHPNSLAHALHNVAMGHHFVGDRERTFLVAQSAAAIAEKFALLPWRASSLVVMGWASAEGLGVADAAQVVDAHIGNATSVGPVPQLYLGLAAEVMLAAGRPVDALAHLERAIAAIDEPGVGLYLPEIYRLRGKCLLALDRANKEEAKRAFAMAREVANRQGAVIFERRAETSLAELEGG